MRTLKLTIAYDGTRYAGWQIQRQGPRELLTIQGTLQRLLRQMLQEPVHVIGSGRTDAGVHAEAQVAHLKTRSTMPAARLQHSVNRLLPPDIAVMALQEVPRTFQAQYHATSKWYRYRWYLGGVAPPFIRPYVTQVRAPLRVARMREALKAVVGRRDFHAFARSGQECRTTVRTITQATLTRRGHELLLDLKGNGFLHTMVRSIAGTLMDVGRGRRTPDTLQRMVRTKQRGLAGVTAPARGLTLMGVRYGAR
jgi:tRNA pseudouridine38-40 synthase